MARSKTCRACCGTSTNFYEGHAACKACVSIEAKLRREANPLKKSASDRAYRIAQGEVLRAKKRAYQQANKERENARCRAWYAAGGAEAKAKAAKWRIANPELSAELVRKWKKDNYGRVRSHGMSRKNGVKRATPFWSESFFFAEAHQLAVLREIATGIAWEVDHIEPINGRDVCGLHVPSNIRVIPAKINYKKKNNRVSFAHWLGFDDK